MAPSQTAAAMLALTDDPELLELLIDGEPLGAGIRVRPQEKVNRAVLA